MMTLMLIMTMLIVMLMMIREMLLIKLLVNLSRGYDDNHSDHLSRGGEQLSESKDHHLAKRHLFVKIVMMMTKILVMRKKTMKMLMLSPCWAGR